MMIKINNVLNTAELNQIRSLIADATWQPGSASAGLYAQQQKANQEMDQSCQSWKKINEHVVTRLFQHPEYQRTVLPNRVAAAYISRYTEGMSYGAHIDDPVMGGAGGRYRGDVATTVFLSEPADYQGGELTIHTRFGPVQVKLAAGSAVVYPASSLHEVAPIRSGERIVCALWAQSIIRDAQQREILADLDDARSALKQTAPEAKVTQAVDQAYMNLVRMWAEV
jgi:PKHD-type hydroxylase